MRFEEVLPFMKKGKKARLDDDIYYFANGRLWNHFTFDDELYDGCLDGEDLLANDWDIVNE